MNKKSTKERAQMLQLLVEGNSLRATSRITGASINTVTKLLVEAGEACAAYQDKHLRNLPCKRVQVDEIWSFVYAKEANVPDGMEGQAGDVWTWTSIDAQTKLVPSWRVGDRSAEMAVEFIEDLASRLANRVQLSSDGLAMYLDAVEGAFGRDVDYSQIIKIYARENGKNTSECVGIRKAKVVGNPDKAHVSTSFVERQNLTMRMSMRRFTRMTNGFSKKVENHCHAIALHFMNYNFCRIHKTLRVTPAMAAGVSDKLWSLEDVVIMMDSYFLA